MSFRVDAEWVRESVEDAERLADALMEMGAETAGVAPVEEEHRYLSTGCLHGEHSYCQSMTGQQGEKRPGRCKFCDAQCRCPCHRPETPDRA